MTLEPKLRNEKQCYKGFSLGSQSNYRWTLLQLLASCVFGIQTKDHLCLRQLWGRVTRRMSTLGSYCKTVFVPIIHNCINRIYDPLVCQIPCDACKVRLMSWVNQVMNMNAKVESRTNTQTPHKAHLSVTVKINRQSNCPYAF